MKYSSTNTPLFCEQSQSTWLRGAVKGSTPVGILWHDTGAGNPNISRYVQPNDDAIDRDYWISILGKNKYANDWNHTERNAGLNCWIGKLADGSIATVQTGPWTTTPWGCGSGSKGSCNGYVSINGKTSYINQHWIQFEICDDKYVSKDYFDAVFEEACQISAYLCWLYNINPKSSVDYNGVAVPTILCHADAHKLQLGSNHADVYTWFNKFGKSMDDARNRISEILNEASSVQYYRVRKSWADSKSQVGAYKNLDNAKAICDEVGEGYHVFDGNGNIMHSAIIKSPTAPSKPGVYSTGSEEDIRYIWDFLKVKIPNNDIAIAAIMGNIYAESAFVSNNLQKTFEAKLNHSDLSYTNAVDDTSYGSFISDRAGYGLCQWTYSTRKQALLEFSIAKGKSIGDLDMQLEFLWDELSTTYVNSVLQPLLQASSIREASDIVLIKYEAPAAKDEPSVQELRASYAQKYYDMFHKEEVFNETLKENECEIIESIDDKVSDNETKHIGSLLLNLVYNIVTIIRRLFRDRD